jgi:hypothetical protein
MFKQNPGILFVGNPEKAQALEKALANSVLSHTPSTTPSTMQRQWLVYHVSETIEALSTYLFSYPDVVVIDRADYPITAAEVSFHLHSLGDDTPILVVSLSEYELRALATQIEAILTETLVS